MIRNWSKLTKVFSVALVICLTSCSRKEEPVTPSPVVHNSEDQAVINEAKEDARYQEYKHEQERRIKENDDRIEELRAKIDKADERMREEYRQRISDLKDKNERLRTRMNEYKHESDAKWEEFKKEWNHDMDELGNALKDFSVKNTR